MKKCIYNCGNEHEVDDFSKEIMIHAKGVEGIRTLQYHDEQVFDTMLARLRKWESEGKLDIIDVRDSQYSVA